MSFLEKHSWLGHIVEALVMFTMITAAMSFAIGVIQASIVAASFAAGHWHGREKRDYENEVGMRPPHLKAYLIWRWKGRNLAQSVPIMIFALAYVTIVAAGS